MVETVDPVTIALIGAGGAVVGGVLTAGSSILLETFKLKTQRKAAEQHDTRELRRARRLVLDELAKCRAYLDNAVKNPPGWPPTDKTKLPKSAWESYASVLADHISDDTWYRVTRAYGRMEIMEGFVNPVAHTDSVLADTRKTVDEAMSKLQTSTVSQAQGSTSA